MSSTNDPPGGGIRGEGASIENLVPTSLGAPIREVWKPDISHLPNAIVDGKLIVPEGQDIVIQYPDISRETSVYKIMKIFDEKCPTEVQEYTNNEGTKISHTFVKGTVVQVGYVRLLDLQRGHYAATDYLTAENHGLIVKVWTGKKKK